MSSPEQSLWIDSAASWPCATAQMMFFGPNAASPPKNTFGLVEPMVLASTLGMSHLSNSMPQSRSIQGKAFSWPTATSTSSQGMVWSGSPVGTSSPALGVVLGLHLLEGDAGELAVVVNERGRHHEIEDRNVLVNGVLFLPGARLHLLEAGTHDHLDVLAAEAARGAAAIHRGVAAAEHDHAFADLVGVAERNPGEPVDADMDMARPLPCGRGCRARGRAARRSRRKSRPSFRRAAP